MTTFLIGLACLVGWWLLGIFGLLSWIYVTWEVGCDKLRKKDYVVIFFLGFGGPITFVVFGVPALIVYLEE